MTDGAWAHSVFGVWQGWSDEARRAGQGAAVPMVTANPCVIVAGPTCSGKSALALLLARRLGGVVINADAMQVYRELRVLTARPTPADEVLTPHRLYGVRAAAEGGNVAWWRGAALAEMEAAWAAGRLPILCGGTGLYLHALTDGLVDIPEPDTKVRAEARALLAEIGAVALHGRLEAVDPASAARLRPGDGQRVARAWEVWRGTGRGIAAWQRDTPAPSGWSFRMIRLDPPRATLRQAIAARFAAMLEAGALDEVAALLALGLPRELPLMRAHGVPELAAALRGDCAVEEAVAQAVSAQTRYTKRQATWFAHHTLADPIRTLTIDTRMAGMTQQMERLIEKSVSFVMHAVDAPTMTG